MKYINKYKSPNYNSRKNSKIQLIIIHYTALKNTLDAISYLCNNDKKVSSHYLISQNGTVYNLVKDKFFSEFLETKPDTNDQDGGTEMDEDDIEEHVAYLYAGTNRGRLYMIRLGGYI